VSLIRQVAAKKRPTSIDLGMGEPSLRPTQAFLDAGAAYIAQHGLRYSPNAGETRLREAIARHYNYPAMSEPANVCVTIGSQEAMYAIFKTLLDPARDDLLIVEPTFPSYAKMARLEGIGLQIVRARAEDDFAFVLLSQSGQETQCPGHPADADEEDPGGVGIEGTGMAHAPLAEDPAAAGHDIVRGPTGLLVHHRQPQGSIVALASRFSGHRHRAVRPRPRCRAVAAGLPPPGTRRPRRGRT